MKPYVPNQLPIEGLNYQHLFGLAQTSSSELPFQPTIKAAGRKPSGTASPTYPDLSVPRHRTARAVPLPFAPTMKAVGRKPSGPASPAHPVVSVARHRTARAVPLQIETETKWTWIAHKRAFLFTRMSLADLAAAAAGRGTAVHGGDETEDTGEPGDIGKLNGELRTTVARIDQLRTEIEVIVAEIEGEEVEA